jgi:hypothetical protein
VSWQRNRWCSDWTKPWKNSRLEKNYRRKSRNSVQVKAQHPPPPPLHSLTLSRVNRPRTNFAVVGLIFAVTVTRWMHYDNLSCSFQSSPWGYKSNPTVFYAIFVREFETHGIVLTCACINDKTAWQIWMSLVKCIYTKFWKKLWKLNAVHFKASHILLNLFSTHHIHHLEW